jgi:hypothetical protein
MLQIETSGSWGGMGHEFGRALGDVLRRAVDAFVPRLRDDATLASHVASILEHRISAHCPSVLEETQGMAEGAGIPPDVLLAYRFVGEVNSALDVGCTVCFINTPGDGPLLARNCDIEKDWSVEIQTCWIRRPSGESSFVHNGYAGMVSPGAAMNEHGLGMAGASSHVSAGKTSPASKDPPASIFALMCMLGCRTVSEAATLISQHRFFSSKAANWIVADDTGQSMIVEVIRNEYPTQIPRPRDRSVQFCTNHSLKHIERIEPEAGYLQSSYARYGRLFHRLLEQPMELNRAHLSGLMAEVAEPGVCIAEQGLKLHTCYTTLFDLKRRVQYLADGHPTRAVHTEIVL